MNRILIILAILLAGIVVFLVLATGGRESTGTGGAAKILHLAIDTDPKTLDPISITDTISDGVARKIHNTLVRFQKDAQTGELRVVPDLAERFAVSPDGKTYTFTLRRGVKFHNGREMRAADVVYSLARLLSPESKRPEWLMPMVAGSEERYRGRHHPIPIPRGFKPIAAGSEKRRKAPWVPLGIIPDGPYTVTIKLNAPFAPFIQHLCTVNCAVVPKEAVEDKSHIFGRSPVGVGAFKLTEWRNNEKLVLTRNEEYFKGRPKLNAVEFHIVKEPSIRMERFFNGDLHAAGDLPNGRVREAMQRAGPANSFKYTTFRTSYLGLGMPNGNFKDKASLRPFGTNKLLRQAISYAIDREYLCETVLEGRGTPARGVLPPGMPGFKAGRPGWPKDAAKAAALLAEAGYPRGQGLPALPILYRNDENQKKIAQAVAEDLDKVGIQAELQPREWNSFLDMVESEPRPAFMLGWVADYPDPDNFLYVLFNSKQWGPPGNDTWYANPRVDALTEQARNLTDMAARIPLYQQAEDLILDDSPWICTYHVVNEILLSSKVKGIRENVTPLDTGTEFPQVDFAFVDIE